MKSIYPKDSGQEYIKKINDVLSVDSRERVFQDYIISPFLQFVLNDYDVVPVDIKVSGKIHKYELYCGRYGYIDKDSELHICTETPDLCVANNWKWLNADMKREDYVLTVEIKTPFSDNEYWISPGYMDGKIVFENKTSDIVKFINEKMLKKNESGEYLYDGDSCYPKSIEKQIGIHIRCMEKVIATDGVRWIFLYRKNDSCYEFATIDLGRRICKKPRKYDKYVKIDWDDQKIDENFSLLQETIKMFCKNNINDLDAYIKQRNYFGVN